MPGSESKERVESHLYEFSQAHRAGKRPVIAEFAAREPEDPNHVYLSSLIEEDFRGRLARGERPWISDYFELDRLFDARKAVCRCLSGLLFKGKSALATQLGIAEFGKYKAIELAGFGAFGMVLKAREEGQAKNVAVKLAHPKVDQALAFLKNEHHSLANLDRVPCISSVIDAGRLDDLDSQFLILDWVEGQTLDAWRISQHNRLYDFEICRQLSRIVDDIHRTCCHGDLSPSNILVAGSRGRPSITLVDFGNSISSFVRGRPFPFTARYTAPELLLNESERPSKASDLWSLSVVLIELLSDNHPFGEFANAESPKELGEHFRDGPTSLRRPDDVPELCWNFLTACLSPKPIDRLQYDARTILGSITHLDETLPSPSYRRDGQDRSASSPSIAAAESGSPRPSGKCEIAQGASIDDKSSLKVLSVAGKRRISPLVPLLFILLTFAAMLLLRIWPTIAPVKVPAPDALITAAVIAPESEVTNGIGMKFKLIPAGSFTMGSPVDERVGDDLAGLHGDPEAQHAVTIQRPFYMEVCDVTRGEFAQFYAEMNAARPYRTKAQFESATRPSIATWLNPIPFKQEADHPVVAVTWFEAVEFTDWMSKKDGNRYRLPRGAEWEYACRANAAHYSIYNTGNRLSPDQANFGHNNPGTTSVWKFEANSWGLRDMHGNVWQWCEDRWGEPLAVVLDYPDKPAPVNDRISLRIARGGGWTSTAGACRSANFFYQGPDEYSIDLGFRVVADLPFKPAP